MSYSGLGAYYEATFSVLGKNITAGVDVPIEQAARDAVAGALPVLQAQIPGAVAAALPTIQAQIPEVVKAATPPLVAALKTKILPELTKTVESKIGGQIKFAIALAGAGAIASIVTSVIVLRQRRA